MLFVIRNINCAVQIENLLFDSYGYVKLCDFGSATTEVVTPDETWSALQRAQLEEEVSFLSFY